MGFTRSLASPIFSFQAAGSQAKTADFRPSGSSIGEPNNQEFQYGSRDEQEIATGCKVLIQNAIVLWNTLYLSERLSGVSNVDEQREMLSAITSASLLTWQHVNLQGEYDFRQVAANDEPFNMQKIRALKLI